MHTRRSPYRIPGRSRLLLISAAVPVAVLFGAAPGCEPAQHRDSDAAAVAVTALMSLKEGWIADAAAIHGREGIAVHAVDAARAALGIERYDSTTTFCPRAYNPLGCVQMIVEITRLEIEDGTARVGVTILGPASPDGWMYGREGTVVLEKTRGSWRVLHIEEGVIASALGDRGSSSPGICHTESDPVGSA